MLEIENGISRDDVVRPSNCNKIFLRYRLDEEDKKNRNSFQNTLCEHCVKQLFCIKKNFLVFNKTNVVQYGNLGQNGYVGRIGLLDYC